MTGIVTNAYATPVTYQDNDDPPHRTVNLDEVVVSANKSVVKRKDAPVVVNVLNSSQIGRAHV